METDKKRKKKKSILIVDGSKLIHDAFDVLFSSHGYVLIHCYNAKEAMDMLSGYMERKIENNIGIAFVENSQIGIKMDGAELIHLFKSKVPSMRLYAMGTQKDKNEKIIRLGASHFFEKPFLNVSEIVRIVENEIEDLPVS